MWNKGPIFPLPHRVTVQNPSIEEFDESGDLITQELTEPVEMPAFVDTSAGGREFAPVPGGMAAHVYSATVYMVHDARITGDTRITWEGRTFHVAAPIDYGFNYIMAIPCAEVAR